MSLKSLYKRLSLYAVTSYYLKPVQIVYRIKMLFYTRILHRFKWYRDSYLSCATGSEPFKIVQFPYIRPANTDVSSIDSGNFCFLNRYSELGIPTNWNPSSETKLWIYNLHYFDYVRSIALLQNDQLDGKPYALFRRLVCEWIASCPVAAPRAWDSYPISLRLSNWLRAYTAFFNELESDRHFSRKLRKSMYTQTIFLEKHLEYEVLNNHLLENGRALWLMGRFFQGADADRWRAKGLSILMDGLRDDFYADGGHDERSPMYHQIMLDVYQEMVDIIEMANEHVPDYLVSRVSDIKKWLTNVLHPDGDLALFNDCAFDIAGAPSDFIDSASPPEYGLTALLDSGFFVIRDQENQNFMMFDCGSMGPDHRNGHGHCGALSFEMSISGQRFIVDSGVSDYHGDIKWRDYFRSTRAHNTVVIDGQEQSEIWDRFRVAQRYQPKDVISSESDELTYIVASHTGYYRLPGNVMHRRWLCNVDQKFWVVCDLIEGRGAHTIESFLHFHPDVQVVRDLTATDYGHSGELVCGDTTLQILSWGACNTTHYHGQQLPLQGHYAPRFGECVENTVWGLEQNKSLPAWLGYVLLPDESEAILQFTANESIGNLQITFADDTYSLIFNYDKVELERG